MITIYHHPRCSKSRQTLDIIRSKGIEPEIILYMQSPPDTEVLKELLSKLNMKAYQLLRQSKPLFKDLNLATENITEAQLVRTTVKYLNLIERPIVVSGDRAVLGRPPENVLTII